MASETTTTNPLESFRQNSIQTMLWLLDNMIWPILLLVLIVFALLLPPFFTTIGNAKFILYSSAAAGALALAESLCLLSGNFDLSVGSIAGFSAMFSALFLTQWFPSMPGVVGIFIILAVGGFIGLMNGFSIAYLGVNPFLQTLAFFIVFRGGVRILSTLSISGLPDTYIYIGGGSLGGFIQFAVPLILGLFAVAWFTLKYTRFGAAIYATGGDEDAAAEAASTRRRSSSRVYCLWDSQWSRRLAVHRLHWCGNAEPRSKRGLSRVRSLGHRWHQSLRWSWKYYRYLWWRRTVNVAPGSSRPASG